MAVYQSEDWHSEESKLTPTSTFDLLTSNRIGDLSCAIQVVKYQSVDTHTYRVDKRPTPVTTST